MTLNMGGFDRMLRFLVAILIGALWYTGTITGVLVTVLGIVAIVFFITSLVGWCPLYTLFGFSTRKPVTPTM